MFLLKRCAGWTDGAGFLLKCEHLGKQNRPMGLP